MIAIVLSALALCVTAFNLLLSYGIIRRLREQDAALAEARRRPGAEPTSAGPRVGARVQLPAGPDGSDDSGDAGGEVPSPTLVGFFAPGCASCEEMLPAFSEAATAHPGGRERVRAIVAADGPADGGAAGDASRYADALAAVAVVVAAPAGSAWFRAFQADAFPQVHALSETGELRWSAASARELRRRIAA
jgi:thiol-disulfide isomerase/thioredoxin